MLPAGIVRRSTYNTVAAALALIIGAALPASALSQQQPDPATATAQAQIQPRQTGIIDRVLVRVSGQAILYSDFEARWQQQLEVISGQLPQAQIDAQADLLRMRMMRGMVEEVMLEQRAEELGIAADANEIDRAIMSIREDNGLMDDNLWRQALAQNGITEPLMREQAARSIVQQRMIFQEISRQVFVSQREIGAYYEANQSQFSEPEQVLFQQLIFAYAGADRTPIQERADNALTELRAGISLSAVGNKYSADVVQDAAGASWLSPDDLQPEIVAVIQDLSPLTYSDVVEGRFGYHILQLMDRKEGRTLALEEVGGFIRNQLQERKMGEKLDEYTTELIKTTSLEVYAEEFDELPNQWAEENQGEPTGTPRQQRR